MFTGLCSRLRTVQYRNVLSPNLAVTLEIAGPSNTGGDTGCCVFVEFLRLECGGVLVFGAVGVVVGCTNSGSNTVSVTHENKIIYYQ